MKDCLGYNGLYLANEDGNIYSTRRKKYLSPQKNNKYGHSKVRLYNNGWAGKFVHKLVWEAFNGKVENGYEIDHIDNDPTNNRLDNLQLLTHRKNTGKASKRLNKSSEYTGVCLFKATGKWCAYIDINGKRKHLGFFNEEYNAAEAYYNAVKLINPMNNI